MKKYYVYIWYFCDTQKVFYVGKGKGLRYKEKKDRNHKFLNYINKFECSSKKLYEGLSEEEAYKKEIETIAFYKSKGEASCNLTPGGDNPPTFYGVEHPRSRKIVQLSLDGEYIKSWDCIMDVEKSLKGCNSLIVRACKEKVNSAYGYMWVYEDKYNQNAEYKYSPKTVAKPILQYSLAGDFMKEWKSAKQVNEQLGYRRSSICSCCKGDIKTCEGYIWKYKTNEDIPLKIDIKIPKKVPTPIIQLDLNGNFLARYKNAVDATNSMGIHWRNNKNILKCCKGKLKTALGYKWIYEYDYMKSEN